MFITFEGIDGSGKSTQAKMLLDFLVEENSIPAILVREPGSTPLSETIRKIIIEQEGCFSPREEALLFNLARCRLVDTVIKPALDRGEWVLCDRYTTSTTVYQGEDSLPVSEYASLGIEPDLEILLDLDPRVARMRKHGSGEFNWLDQKVDNRVRHRYQKWSSTRKSCLTIDASKERSEVFNCIVYWIQHWIGDKNNG